MKLSFSVLKHNPFVKTCWDLKWPVVGMPVLGYGIAYGKGAVAGAGILAGMVVAFCLFWLFSKIRWQAYRSDQRRLRAICPYCKRLLEGRKRCRHCENEISELSPFNYVKGIRVLDTCPACGKELRPGDIGEQCFQKDCERGPLIDEFAARLGRVVLMIVRELEPVDEKRTISGGEEKREAWISGEKGAAVIVQALDTAFSPGLLDSRTRGLLDAVWVQKGANPGAVSNLSGLHRAEFLDICFEDTRREPGPVPDKLRDNVRFDISKNKFLEELEHFCRNGERRSSK